MEVITSGSILNIKSFVPLSMVDWPGKLVSVIFLGSCNLRCPWCQNSDIAFHPGQVANLDINDLLMYLNSQNGAWIDGIVISGGEPTLDPTLSAFITILRQRLNHRVLIKLDTNGSYPDMVEHLIKRKCIDAISLDIKNDPCDVQAVSASTGLSTSTATIYASDLIRTIHITIASGIRCEYRTTLVPGLVSVSNVKRIIDLLKTNYIRAYTIQKYKALNSDIEVSFTTAEISEISSYAQERLVDIYIKHF